MINLTALIKERDRQGVNAEGIAMKAGVHANTVRRALNGENVGIYALEAIAEALGCKIVITRRADL